MSTSESTDEKTESSEELDEQSKLESDEGEEGTEEEEVDEESEESDETEDQSLAQTERMLHADYTQKTQDLAQERKDSRLTTEATLNQYKSVFEAQLAELDKVDVDDFTNSENRAFEKRRNRIEKAIDGIDKDVTASKQATPEELQQETQALSLLMPHWHTDQGLDQSKMQKDIQLILDTAKDAGVSLEPNSNLYRVLYEAAQFRKLEKGKLSTGKQTLKISTSTKPAKKKVPSKKKSREALYYGT